MDLPALELIYLSRRQAEKMVLPGVPELHRHHRDDAIQVRELREAMR